MNIIMTVWDIFCDKYFDATRIFYRFDRIYRLLIIGKNQFTMHLQDLLKLQ